MNDEVSIFGCIVASILALALLIALCVCAQRHFEYKNAFSQGYTEVQNIGTTGTHWELRKESK